jgi:hypothetical protein
MEASASLSSTLQYFLIRSVAKQKRMHVFTSTVHEEDQGIIANLQKICKERRDVPKPLLFRYLKKKP